MNGMEQFGWSRRGGWANRSLLHRRQSRQSVGNLARNFVGNFVASGGVGFVRGLRLRRSVESGRDVSARSDSGTGHIGLFPQKSAGGPGVAIVGSAADGDDDRPLMRRKRVEAVLFLSRSPVPSRKLSQLAGLADATEARTLVRQLNQVYVETGRAFRAEEVAGGYKLMTRPPLAPWLRRLGHIPKTLQLTPPALETLSIVAYRQPVLRAEIEAIRGVACGEILRQLMERDLVRISGRSEELGRPYLYSTTKCFLQTFGFRDADALPALDRSDFTISENPDWSNASASSDPSLDHQQPEPVIDAPEEESNVSTAVANLEIDNPASDDVAYVGLFPGQENAPVAVIDDDEEDEIFVDDDEDDGFEDDDDWDDDEEEDEDDEEDDEEADVEVEPDAEWEEVEDDDEEEDDEEEDEDDDWDDDTEDDDWDAEDDAEEDEDEWD